MSRRPSIRDFLSNLANNRCLWARSLQSSRATYGGGWYCARTAVEITVNRAAERVVPRPVRTNTYTTITTTRRRRQER